MKFIGAAGMAGIERALSVNVGLSPLLDWLP